MVNLKALRKAAGFSFIKDFADSDKLIEEAKRDKNNLNREKIKEYDWEIAVERIFGICGGKVNQSCTDWLRWFRKVSQYEYYEK